MKRTRDGQDDDGVGADAPPVKPSQPPPPPGPAPPVSSKLTKPDSTYDPADGTATSSRKRREPRRKLPERVWPLTCVLFLCPPHLLPWQSQNGWQLMWADVPKDLSEDTARDLFSPFGIVTACTVGKRPNRES